MTRQRKVGAIVGLVIVLSAVPQVKGPTLVNAEPILEPIDFVISVDPRTGELVCTGYVGELNTAP